MTKNEADVRRRIRERGRSPSFDSVVLLVAAPFLIVIALYFAFGGR